MSLCKDKQLQLQKICDVVICLCPHINDNWANTLKNYISQEIVGYDYILCSNQSKINCWQKKPLLHIIIRDIAINHNVIVIKIQTIMNKFKMYFFIQVLKSSQQ